MSSAKVVLVSGDEIERLRREAGPQHPVLAAMREQRAEQQRRGARTTAGKRTARAMRAWGKGGRQ